jgi:hypothetical protein
MKNGLEKVKIVDVTYDWEKRKVKPSWEREEKT